MRVVKAPLSARVGWGCNPSATCFARKFAATNINEHKFKKYIQQLTN